MTIIEVEMLAFQEGEIRKVPICITSNMTLIDILDVTYHNGQNDVLPESKTCSVSTGDVIRYEGDKYLVCVDGFRKLSEVEYNEYLAIPRRERSLAGYTRYKSNV